jgi:1,4-alpha-glucan branching enzyme
MLSVRAFLPDSQQAWIVDREHQAPRPMRRVHPAGLYEGLYPLDESGSLTQYQLLTDLGGVMKTLHDPYAFAPLLTDFDLHLFGEGKLLKAYEKFGAQPRVIDGVSGSNFAVWAPNARSVSLVGDFNTNTASAPPMAKSSTKATPTASRLSCRPAPPRS